MYGSCAPDAGETLSKCRAENAIDGNPDTISLTTSSKPGWWQAEFSRTSKVEKIHVFLNRYAHSEKAYEEFKVELQLPHSGVWVVCKGPYAVAPPLKPHVIRCNEDINAKYIKISTNARLYLGEVQVFGFAKGKCRYRGGG